MPVRMHQPAVLDRILAPMGTPHDKVVGRPVTVMISWLQTGQPPQFSLEERAATRRVAPAILPEHERGRKRTASREPRPKSWLRPRCSGSLSIRSAKATRYVLGANWHAGRRPREYVVTRWTRRNILVEPLWTRLATRNRWRSVQIPIGGDGCIVRRLFQAVAGSAGTSHGDLRTACRA